MTKQKFWVSTSSLFGFLALPSPKRWLLLEAILWLGLARAAVVVLPLRWIMVGLGQSIGIATSTAQLVGNSELQGVAWAISVASRRTPWQSNCLAQALAGQIMLRRRGIASTLYLGVMKEGPNMLVAHAWLSSQAMIVTGGHQQLERYVVVASFFVKSTQCE